MHRAPWVTGASDSIAPMTPQPLRFMCSGAVLPLQCFTLGVPTARLPADLCATLLYNAVVPCWRTFAQNTRHPSDSVSVAKRRSCGRGVAAQSRTQNSDAGCRQVTILYTILANCVCNKPRVHSVHLFVQYGCMAIPFGVRCGLVVVALAQALHRTLQQSKCSRL